MLGGNGSFSVSGAGLPVKYLTDHLHFHWGRNDSVGSEHTINGDIYPMEVSFAKSVV